ncbi:MAG: GLPGLI family protein [Chitinophagaceae bacterium]|nr:GLPGLI family protein [Chitinophagaceae bacterium]
MKKIINTLLILVTLSGNAQSNFISSGKIEFEKKVNLQKETEDQHWLDGIRDKLPKYRTSFHNLYFKEGKTLFEKGVDNYVKIPFMGDDKSVDDIIYTDLKQGVFYKKQNAFDETFLLSDSIRHIKWQMTNDLRDIAGFECHKAVGKILDSVFVVAFYTDQITTSGGPLSFCRLPGMILGIAIPRSNMTIFATKVELTEPKPEKFSIPTGKTKKADYKSFTQALQKALSDWGDYGKKYIINSLL